MEPGKIYNMARSLAEQVTEAMQDGDMKTTLDELPQVAQTLRSDDGREFAARMADGDYLSGGMDRYAAIETEGRGEQILEHLHRRRTLRIRRRLTVAAAACIVVAAGLLAPWERIFTGEAGPEYPTLILANGESVRLDPKGLETLALAEVAYADDAEIVYSADAAADGPQQMNTIVMPSQYTYKVVLEDSTRVYINANSELRYPARFAGDSREVYLTGEAYFEVAHSDRPFIVHAANMQVKVYGTQFNINTSKHGCSETLLVEGSVGVTPHGGEQVMLADGEMLVVDADGGTRKVVAEADNYLGWRTGYFSYELAPLGHIADDLSAWYGVDFRFADTALAQKKVSISIERSIELEQLIEIIQTVSKIEITKERRTDYVIEEAQRQ